MIKQIELKQNKKKQENDLSWIDDDSDGLINERIQKPDTDNQSQSSM